MKNNEIQKNNNDNSQITKSEKKAKNLLHPMSALLTIAVDWAFFGADAATTGLSLPLTITIASLITFIGSFLIQKNISKNPVGTSLAKAFFLGVMAGIPTPIAGTTVGAAILALAGIRSIFKKT